MARNYYDDNKVVHLHLGTKNMSNFFVTEAARFSLFPVADDDPGLKQ